MRFEHLRIEALGPLKGIDTGSDPLPGFVVVSGPNEAGKSTLLEALRTVLYGFYPAGRDEHPLSPWDGSEAEILATLVPPGGAPLEVHRRLLATPWGRLRENGEESNLRNRDLPGVSHVPLEIFRQVHHLTLSELMALQEGGAWELVRDRIMAGMGTRDFLPPRAVAKGLEDAAQELWRPDRRTKPRDRVLADEVERRSADLVLAREGDREVRKAEAALHHCETALTELREEQARLRLSLERVRTLAPLRSRLDYLDRLAAMAGDPALLAELPPDPVGHLETLRKEERETAEALEDARARERSRRDALPPTGDETTRLAEGAPALEALRAPVSGADEALDRVRGRRLTLAQRREGLAELLHPVLVPEAIPPLVASAGLPGSRIPGSSPGTAPGALPEGPPSSALDLERVIARIPMEEVRLAMARMEGARVRLAGVEEQRELARAALEGARRRLGEEGEAGSTGTEGIGTDRIGAERTGTEGIGTERVGAGGTDFEGSGADGTEDGDMGARGTETASTPWILGGMGVLLVAAAGLFLFLGRGGEVTPWLTLLAGGVLLGVALLLRERARNRSALATARADAHAQALARAGVEARERAREDVVRAGEELHRLERRVEALEGEVAEEKGRVDRYLEDLPLAPARRAHPGESLVTALERILDALRELRRLGEEDAGDRDRSAEVEASLVRVESELLGTSTATEDGATHGGERPPPVPATPSPGSELPTGELAPRLHALLQEAAAARELLRTRREGEEALERLGEEIEALERRAEAAREAREAFELRVRALAWGPDAGPREEDPIRELQARLEAAADARRLATELEAEHGPLPELRERVREAATREAADPEPLSDEVVARMEARLETVGEEIERCLAEAGDHRGILRQMEGRETVDLVESDLARLAEERVRVRRERDRLWLLSRVVRVAERRFREAHQPELIRHAESLLRSLTGGRYDTLLLGDEENPDLLQVRGPHLPDALPADAPLSTGTREQIWFALRMAVIPLVEGEGNPLPLVLDEVFVNWDRDRRSQALEALRVLAEERQIFLVTCHPELAAEAQDHGARRIFLEGP